MNKQLDESLIQFKDRTLDLICALEEDDFDILDDLLRKRQAIIDELNSIRCTNEEFIEATNRVGLLQVQKKVLDLMNSKRLELRREMDKLSEVKIASKSYNSKFAVDSVYFNKKI